MTAETLQWINLGLLVGAYAMGLIQIVLVIRARRRPSAKSETFKATERAPSGGATPKPPSAQVEEESL